MVVSHLKLFRHGGGAPNSPEVRIVRSPSIHAKKTACEISDSTPRSAFQGATDISTDLSSGKCPQPHSCVGPDFKSISIKTFGPNFAAPTEKELVTIKIIYGARQAHVTPGTLRILFMYLYVHSPIRKQHSLRPWVRRGSSGKYSPLKSGELMIPARANPRSIRRPSVL